MSREPIWKEGTEEKVSSFPGHLVVKGEKVMSFGSKVATSKVAIITGASSGIGWELAKVLARQGATVGLLARRLDKLQALAADIAAAGGKATAISADVSQRATAVEAIHKLRGQLGPIDLLVANSGIGLPTALEPPNMDQVDNMIRVNYLGVVYAIEAVLPEMLQRGTG